MRISDWSSDVCSSDLDVCHVLAVDELVRPVVDRDRRRQRAEQGDDREDAEVTDNLHLDRTRGYSALVHPDLSEVECLPDEGCAGPGQDRHGEGRADRRGEDLRVAAPRRGCGRVRTVDGEPGRASSWERVCQYV